VLAEGVEVSDGAGGRSGGCRNASPEVVVAAAPVAWCAISAELATSLPPRTAQRLGAVGGDNDISPPGSDKRSSGGSVAPVAVDNIARWVPSEEGRERSARWSRRR